MAVISASNLSVTLNEHKILFGISFDVEKGDVVAIIGPNGSGKTTLLKAILGFIPYKGDISLLGKRPDEIAKVASRIGYVPQRFDFDRTIPVTVEEVFSVCGSTSDKDKIKNALSLVASEHLLGSRLGVLSGGEFQRVLLALALLGEPEVLFFDEPTAGIDVEGAGEIYALIQDLRRRRDITILLVSHDIDIVFRYVNKVLCINHELVCSGVPRETLTHETLDRLYGSHYKVYEHGEKKRA